MLISVEGTGKNQLQQGQESMGGCYSAATLLFAKKSLNKPTDVLVHCREGETNCWFSIFRGFSF
jgi:hypothetical protein